MNAAPKISAEIAIHGVIPFARFMELSLYCPVYGYYEAEKDTVGQAGDFYTNVSVGSLFGELLASQFADWLEELQASRHELKIVEAGAHNGQLAKDILGSLRKHRQELFAQLKYLIVEPSPRRQQWQRTMLKEFADKVSWTAALDGQKIRGLIFSNELLDALPLQRFGWDARQKKWFEWGVAKNGGQFVWAKMPNAPSDLCPPQLEAVLPDGYIIEKSPAAENWWREAARALQQGKLLTIDYGLIESELFSPTRTHGTLRGYHTHRVTEDVLSNPGEQDITAHVNFSAIQKAGESEGLTTEALIAQPKFLTDIVGQISKSNPTFEWMPIRARQLQTLTHPEHLGRAFRVLIQSRD